MLGINQRYSSSKNAVEMYSTYRQDVNFKNFIIFNLFYLRFCFGPGVCTGNFGFKIYGVVPCLGSVRNNNLTSYTHTHTHTHTILFQNFTNKCCLHTIRSSHATFSLCHCHEPRLIELCLVLFQSTDLFHNFQFYTIFA